MLLCKTARRVDTIRSVTALTVATLIEPLNNYKLQYLCIGCSSNLMCNFAFYVVFNWCNFVCYQQKHLLYFEWNQSSCLVLTQPYIVEYVTSPTECCWVAVFYMKRLPMYRSVSELNDTQITTATPKSQNKLWRTSE